MEQEENLAKSYGFQPHPEAKSHLYTRSNTYLWLCASGWSLAEFANNRLQNLKSFQKLEEALEFSENIGMS